MRSRAACHLAPPRPRSLAPFPSRPTVPQRSSPSRDKPLTAPGRCENKSTGKRERGLPVGCHKTYNGLYVLTAQETTGSCCAPFPQAKTRVWGSPGFGTTRIGASSDLSPASRWACAPCSYDSASARLVYPNGVSSSFTYDSLNRVTQAGLAKARRWRLTTTRSAQPATARKRSNRAAAWSTGITTASTA